MIEENVFKRGGPVKRTPQRKVGMGNRGDVEWSNGDDVVVGMKQPSRSAFGEIFKVGIATGSENVPPLGIGGHTLGVREGVEPCKGSLWPSEKDNTTMSVYEDFEQQQPINHSEEPPPQEPRRTSETVDSAPHIEAEYISRELMMALSHDEEGTAEQQPVAADCLPRPWRITETNSQPQMQPPLPPAMVLSEKGGGGEEATVSATAKPSTQNNFRGHRYGVRCVIYRVAWG